MTRTLTAATIALAVSASGCGETKRPHPAASITTVQSTTATPAQAHPSVQATSKSRFFATVEPICKQLNTALHQNAHNRKASEAGATSARNAALEHAALLRLSKVVPPPSLATDWKTMNKYRRTLVAQLLKLANDYQTHNTKDENTLSRAKQKTHNLLLVLAGNDHFNECAQVGTNFHLRLGGN